jgi:hypothetical protein
LIPQTIRNAVALTVLAGSAPMLAADAPIVDPVVRAGTWIATASEIDIGGNLPPGGAEGVERSVRKPREVCYQPDRIRGGRARSLLEAFAGSPCNAERAAVDGQRFNGKMACRDESTFGSTSYEGTFDQTSAEVDLTVDMSFKDTDWRMFMTTHMKFEWQGPGCGGRD